MPTAKPCLGYPSRSDAVMALTENGLSDHQIACKTGIPKKNIGALRISAQRKRQGLSARAADEDVRTVRVPIETLDRLAPAATERGIAVNALARWLLDEITESDLVDAVLDDGVADA